MDVYIPYFNAIDEKIPSRLEMLRRWVEINTYSLNINGLNHFSSLIASSFKELGGVIEFIDLPLQQILSVDGKREMRSFGKALAIRKRPEAPLKIFLGGHFDTVFPPSSPFQKVQEEGGIWRGPGCADMKGGLGILLLALEALESSAWCENIGWEVLLTPDEEIGSPGSAPLYLSAGSRCHLGLIFEPAFSDGAYVSARKGSTAYTVVVHGRAAHVGREFSQGRSAILPLVRLILRLEQMQEGRDLTVNVAELEGKGPLNIVPDLAGCRVNMRSFSSEILKEASKELHQAAKELSDEQEGIRFEIVQDTERLAKPFDRKTEDFFHSYALCAKELDLPFQIRETGGVCDGNLLASRGLPVLDSGGVVGGALHTHDEYFVLSSFAERAKLASLFLLKLARDELRIS